MPPKSPDIDTAKEKLHRQFATMEEILLRNVDDLAQAGFSDKRWCAIARTHFEEGFLALHRALRDYPGDDQSNYGKVPYQEPLPKGFDPPVDPEGHRQVGEGKKIEWREYGPDKKTR